MADQNFTATRRGMLAGTGVLGLASALVSPGHAAEPTAAAVGGKEPIPRPATHQVERAFVRIAEGPVHYRFMGVNKRGGRVPVLMAHAGPGSSMGLAPLIPGLAADNRFVFAPDMLGNGDSPAPAYTETDISYYVDATLRVMDALKIEQVDFYGAHTGAHIGAQMAVDHPHRIRKLVLDGIALFSPAFQRDLETHYAPHVIPDEWGGHLPWAWNFVRDQSLFWPHFAQDGAHRLANSIAPPEAMHRGVVDVLKALATYHIAYHAAFKHDARGVLPRIAHPTYLLASERDPLSEYLDDAAGLVKNAQKLLIASSMNPNTKGDILANFFT